jgi:hypothetical protein
MQQQSHPAARQLRVDRQGDPTGKFRPFSTARMTLCVISLILSSGCTIPELLASDDSTPGTAVTEASIAAARSRWLASGIRDYDFTSRCEGLIHVTPPLPLALVVVRNGHVLRSWYFEHFLHLESAPTMDAIFDDMQREVSSPAYRSGGVDFEAEFDARTGIPTYVWLNYSDVSDSFEYCLISRLWVWRRHQGHEP